MAMGDYLRETGEYEESEAMFMKSLDLNPISEAYLGLGWLYYKQHKYIEAEKAFNSYLEKIRPKSEVYLGLGYTYLSQEKYQQAERAFEESVSLNPVGGGKEALVELKNLY